MSIISMIHAAGFNGLAFGLAVIISANKGNNRHKKLYLFNFSRWEFHPISPFF